MALAFPLLILLGLVGLVLLIKGLRGRIVGDAPFCRACGFELTGLVGTAARCPECGQELYGIRTVRRGRRKRRPRLAMIGLCLVLPGAGAIGMQSWLRANGYNWYRFVPTGWLLSSAEGVSNSRSNWSPARAELARRVLDGSLSNTERSRFVAVLLVDAERAWWSNWSMSKDMLAWLLLRGFLSPKESDSFINLMLTDLEESSPNGSFMCQNVLENLQRSGSLATDQTHRLVTILIDRWRRVPNVNQNLIEEAAKGGWIAGTDWLMLREALESIMKNPQWWGYGADRLLSTLPAEHQRHLVDLLLQLHGDRSRPNPYFWLHTAHSLGLVVDENFRKYIEQVVELKPVIGQPVDLTQGLSIALIGSDLRLVSDEWFFRAAIESISIDAIEVYNATGRSNDRIESPQWQWITDAWGRSFSCRFPAFIESSLLDTQAVRHELARDIELTIIWRIKAVADPDYELRIANLRNGITAGPLDDLTVHEWTYTWSHAVRLGSNRAIVQPLDTPEVKVRSMNCCAEPTAEGNWLMVGVRFTRIPCDLAFEVYAIADDTEYYVGDVAFPEGLEYLGLSVSALVPPLKSGVIEVELRPSDRVAKQSAGLTSYWPHVIRQEDIRVHWHGTNPPPGAR